MFEYKQPSDPRCERVYLYYWIRGKDAVSADLWLNMLTMLIPISRPFIMNHMHYSSCLPRSSSSSSDSALYPYIEQQVHFVKDVPAARNSEL